MLHFGELDAHIPLTDVDKIKQANPQLPIHVYAADHGFNCDHRGSYDATAAELARSRSLEFFAEQLGGEL
jgi:carboxymethylenebutenolidase